MNSNFGFHRAPGCPACRKHHFCVETDPEHWANYDHPSTHAFLLVHSNDFHLPVIFEPPTVPSVIREPATEIRKLKRPSPSVLEIGESVTVTGSRGIDYVITRHPDKQGQPFFWCTCPDRKFVGTKGSHTCKHIIALCAGETQFEKRSRQLNGASSLPTSSTNQSDKFEVALAETFKAQNPIGMYFMEKYDGWFGHWDASSKTLFTRAGNRFHIPDWLIAQMPPLNVTGEIWGGRGTLDVFQSLFSSFDLSNPAWNSVCFKIFDVVDQNLKPQPFLTRMQALRNFAAPNVQVVTITECLSKAQLDQAFQSIVSSNGEGLVLRKNVAYRAGRSSDILKYKKHMTIDAKVIGYTKGSGRYASAQYVGSLRLLTENGAEFKCVPTDRQNPPHIGAIVEVGCMELFASGKPRHPVFVRVRNDKFW